MGQRPHAAARTAASACRTYSRVGVSKTSPGRIREGRGRVPAQALTLYHLADQRIAVRMDPVRGQPQDHVARSHALRQVAAPFHRAHGETGQIKVAAVVKAGISAVSPPTSAAPTA